MSIVIRNFLCLKVEHHTYIIVMVLLSLVKLKNWDANDFIKVLKLSDAYILNKLSSLILSYICNAEVALQVSNYGFIKKKTAMLFVAWALWLLKPEHGICKPLIKKYNDQPYGMWHDICALNCDQYC